MFETLKAGAHKLLDDCPPDLEQPDEVFADFGELVKTSVDSRQVEKWVKTTVVRESIFSEMALGFIKWPRSLGRPDTPNFSDGFRITPKMWVDIWHIGPDGSVIEDLQTWMPSLVPPDLRDGQPDSDSWSVRYMFHAKPDAENVVEIQLATVPWHRPGRAIHRRSLYLSSHGFRFFSGGQFVALPDITVDDQPYFHL